jgi:thymidine phosphorylase
MEARDALAVLRNEPSAPADLRARALRLAGDILEMSGARAPGEGSAWARARLDDGSAWRKLVEICEAQGGMREPPLARFSEPVTSARGGRVRAIDNRLLARVAKLAGAPKAPAAGVQMHVSPGDVVERGQTLFTLHGDARGQLAYARDFVAQHPELLDVAVGRA